jgi:DNA-binding response OmpR family regulator
VRNLGQFDAIGTTGGREGMESYRELRPDVVLLNIGMPDWNGYEVLRALKRVDPSVRAVAVTAHDTLEDKLCSMETGFIDHIPKPFKPQSLADVVRFVANGSDSEIETYRLRKFIELLQEQRVEHAAKLAQSTEKISSSEAVKTFCATLSHNMKGELLQIVSAVERLRANQSVDAKSEYLVLNEELSAIDRSARYIDATIRQLQSCLQGKIAF